RAVRCDNCTTPPPLWVGKSPSALSLEAVVAPAASDVRFGSWPCKKHSLQRSLEKPRPVGLRSRWQPSAVDDVHDPGRIIGQTRESHFRGHFRKRFGELARRARE